MPDVDEWDAEALRRFPRENHSVLHQVEDI